MGPLVCQHDDGHLQAHNQTAGSGQAWGLEQESVQFRCCFGAQQDVLPTTRQLILPTTGQVQHCCCSFVTQLRAVERTCSTVYWEPGKTGSCRCASRRCSSLRDSLSGASSVAVSSSSRGSAATPRNSRSASRSSVSGWPISVWTAANKQHLQPPHAAEDGGSVFPPSMTPRVPPSAPTQGPTHLLLTVGYDVSNGTSQVCQHLRRHWLPRFFHVLAQFLRNGCTQLRCLRCCLVKGCAVC